MPRDNNNEHNQFAYVFPWYARLNNPIISSG